MCKFHDPSIIRSRDTEGGSECRRTRMRFKASKHNTLEVYSVNNSHGKQLSLNVLLPHVFSPRAVLTGF